MATRFSRVLLATTALVPLAAAVVQANPLDGVVQAGQATITATPGLTTVTQTSTRAIINWQAFDIDVGESTVFVQPGTDSVVLNRVTGDLGPSTILGKITSNGFVFVVNPDGILFGAGAIVDTAGFLGTTADIANGDFMAGQYAFTVPGNPQASIVNEGMITAAEGGFAALVAPGVRNSGIITARLGNVALAAGTGFTLDFYGDGLITLAVGDEIPGGVVDLATGQPMAALVDNAGTLAADGGTVAMTAATARQVVDAVINNTGVIEANTVGTRNGRIVLGAATAATTTSAAPQQRVAVGGRLSAAGTENGETGGRVIITGEAITTNEALITAAGVAGGGTVLIGGDVTRGLGTTPVPLLTSSRPELQPIPTATDVWIDAGTTINASAMYGDAGKVVVWADGTTSFNGTISAQSTAAGGYGGFVEVSGLQSLKFDGYVDAGSPLGTAGTLLLDPLNVVIGAGGLSASALQAALATNNVVVTTGTAGTDAGDITVAETISWGTGFSLTLEAYRNIVINDSVVIANTADGDLNLRADATGIGIGTVSIEGAGRVAFGGSTGAVSIFYDPASYTTPTDYSPWVVTNPEVPGQLTAYMLVNDVFDLQDIQQNLAGTYALGRDIDASETATWNGGAGFVPIGQFFAPFLGIFDGDGHIIDRLTIHADNTPAVFPSVDAGLFGFLGTAVSNTVVRDVGLTNVDISNINGAAGGIAGSGYGTILRSFVTGTISVSGTDSWGGGLMGAGATIQDSYSMANVTGDLSTSVVGGLVGTFNGGSITQSYAMGLVIGGPTPVSFGVFAPASGGLVGRDLGPGAGTNVAHSYWDTQSSGQLGSIAGTGLTTAQLTSGLPAGFDPLIWGVDPAINGGYPHLLWQTQFSPSPPLTVFTPPFDVEPPPPPPPPPPPALPFLSDPTGTHQVVGGALGYPLLGPGAPAFSPPAHSAYWPFLNSEKAAAAAPYALIAAAAYADTGGNLSEYGYERNVDSTQLFALYDVYNWALSKATGFYATTFFDYDSRTIIVAFRGTQLSLTSLLGNDPRDVVVDLIDRFEDGPQYSQALAFFDLIAQQYPMYDVVVTGHSLGGALASYVGAARDVPSVTFNALRSTEAQINDGSKQLNVIVTGDLIGDPLTVLSHNPLAVAASFGLGAGYLNGEVLRLNSINSWPSSHSMNTVQSELDGLGI